MDTIKTKTKRFWQQFIKLQDELQDALKQQHQSKITELVRILNDELLSVAGCFLEVEGGDDDFFECTFISGEDKTAQILCAYIKKFAPDRVLDHWIINDCRQPLSEKGFQMRFDVRDLSYGVEDIMVSMHVLEEAQMVDLMVYCEGFEWQEENEKKTITAMLLEMMIGTLQLEAHINDFTCIDVMSEDEEWFALADLYERLLDLVESKKWPEFKDPTQIYRAYKLEKEEISDSVHHDKLLITTCHPELFVEIMNEQRLILDNFNRLGGEYGALVYEHEGVNENLAHQKKQLERELNDLLYSLGLARCIGGALGMHYCYIDVAVFDRNDFKQALLKINEKLPINLVYFPY